MNRKFIFIIINILVFCNYKISFGKIEKLDEGKALLIEMEKGLSLPAPLFDLKKTGLNTTLNYNLYGEFKNISTAKYEYIVHDINSIKRDIGIGIYPYEKGVLKQNDFNEIISFNSYFKNTNIGKNLKKEFYKLAVDDSIEIPIKTFLTGNILQESGHILQAIKAYYAVLVHFPKYIFTTPDKKYSFYLGLESAMAISRLCRDYPELNLSFLNFQFDFKDISDPLNHQIIINPGNFKTTHVVKPSQRKTIRKTFGHGKVQIKQLFNGDFQLQVNNEPFFIRGMFYIPNEIGTGFNYLKSTEIVKNFHSDNNNNGLIDGPYDSWIDLNKNGIRDENEVSVGDFRLMKDIGINAIKLYIPNGKDDKYDPSLVNKQLLRNMHKEYGFYLIAGDFFGSYTIGSGASWKDGTDFTNPEQLNKIKENIKAKVLDLKDEPFLLLWLLGDNNNLTDHNDIRFSNTNAYQHPKNYAVFINEVAKMIHELDPNHPVAINTEGTELLKYFNDFAPEIDIIGINSYRGNLGLNSIFYMAKQIIDKPVLITSYGCDGYKNNYGIDEGSQKVCHEINFRDIVFNQAHAGYAGNSLGGIIDEFIDGWWRYPFESDFKEHNTEGYPIFGFPDGHFNPEWMGIISQGPGKNSPFERQLKQTYFYYKNINEKINGLMND